MNKIYSFIPKKTLVLVVILVITIGLLGLIALIDRPKETIPTPEPVISQSSTLILSAQKSVIGKTTKQELLDTHPNTKEQVLANGDTKFTIDSSMKSRSNEVIFRNDVAIFERAVIPETQRDAGLSKLSDQTLKFGPTEKAIKGSKFYGSYAETHIYASKGFAFIASPMGDEIYELQTFIPTTIEKYLSKYGEDIKEYGEIKE